MVVIILGFFIWFKVKIIGEYDYSARDCPDCNAGKGRAYEEDGWNTKECPACNGTGLVQDKEDN